MGHPVYMAKAHWIPIILHTIYGYYYVGYVINLIRKTAVGIKKKKNAYFLPVRKQNETKKKKKNKKRI